MAITRSSKAAVKDLGKVRQAGPTCLRKLTKERLAALFPTLQARPIARKTSPAVKGQIGAGISKCVQSTYTLNILAQPGVSIVDDLEPAVRAISSPCGNLGWGQIKIVEQCDDSSDTTAGGSSDGDMTHAFQIILYHNGYNHNGNVHRETIAMFQPTTWDPRDLALEQEEVISLDQILSTIRSWRDKVQSCAIVDSLVQELTVMASKGLGFPNGMGNEKRYPGPWDRKAWDQRIAERKAKEVAHKTKTKPKRKASKKK